MPTLQELKDKWFIDGNTEFIEAYPPDTDPPLADAASFDDIGLNFRHTGATLLNHTDGNEVTMLGEGDVYIGMWYDLITRADITTVYNTNWRIDDVQTKSEDEESTALETLIRVAQGSANVYQFVDGNKLVIDTNIQSNRTLYNGGVISTRDFRFPVNGSNHQKFMVAKTATSGWALVGSIDITKNRLDDDTHSGNYDEITHDFGVLVEGPAVADIEKTFVERWNDSSRTRNWPFEAIDPDQPEITEPIGTYAPTGMHSVQVLRTYGLGKYSYSWADPSEKGEFSIWASTLNAIKKAESYIYIEDQTFFTLGWPARCDDIFNPSRQVVDVVYQLGKALERGIKVGILVSNKTTRGFYLNVYEKYQRDYSLRYLQNIANQINPDNFFVGYLHNDNEVIYIHSKMFIADDEFALIGSANIDQRSMTHDSELKLGVVDSANQFAKDLRIRLFKEHLENPSTTEVDLNNYDEAFDYMKSAIQNNQYRLRTYDFYSSEEWKGHAKFMNLIYSPYGGPLNLR